MFLHKSRIVLDSAVTTGSDSQIISYERVAHSIADEKFEWICNKSYVEQVSLHNMIFLIFANLKDSINKRVGVR